MDNGRHQHKFYLWNTKNSFEQVELSGDKALYEMVEYAILFCNCGETIKRKVKSEEDTWPSSK